MTKVTLFNADLSTGNLGVSALGYSVMSGLARRIDDLALTIADSGRGIRTETSTVDGRPIQYKRCGVRLSRHLYRSEALWNIRMSAKFGGGWNPIARHLMKQDFILDITAGDSFTDLYGEWRFRSCTQAKLLALEWNIPLGLLPQTYGPFQDPKHRAIAVDIIRKSHFAWARDERSYGILQELLGSDFDAVRHQSGVDVAFLLEVVQPTEAEIGSQAMRWLADTTKPTVGINISGLIYNEPDRAVSHYGFVADYRQVIAELVRRMLKQSDVNVLLVPHVVTSLDSSESDLRACQEVQKAFEAESQGRLHILPELKDPRHVKWVISRCHWFCGTRMHSTIAGLSTRVPTAAIAYSLKTAGVFETCQQGDHVADPRDLSTEKMVEQLWKSWQSREAARRSLAEALPSVLEQANHQMDQIAAACQSGRTAAAVPVGITTE